ncbi:hypothetical protein Ancab_002351 [Ancistrocladus abbreviatus]
MMYSKMREPIECIEKAAIAKKLQAIKEAPQDVEFMGDGICSEDNYVGAGILNYEEPGVRYIEALGLSIDDEGDGLIEEGLKNAEQELKIVGMILIQPFFGAEKRSKSELKFQWNLILTIEHLDFAWKQFLPEGSNRDHPAVNVFGSKSKDISSLIFPATLIVTSGLDPLQDWSRRYYEWLMKSGKEAKLIEYPTMPHTFYAYLHVPESSMLINEMKEFISIRTSLTTQTTIAHTSKRCIVM